MYKRQVHGLGVRIALDDFGAGRAPLALLAEVPVSVIKVHPMLTEDAGRTAIARAVARMADDLGIDAVAKGVESAAQARRLHDIGYRQAQGFHLAPPMSAGRLDAYLRFPEDSGGARRPARPVRVRLP